ncbi:MAG: glycosyltransferase family 4 protein [Lachnospiraceae bacterium]
MRVLWLCNIMLPAFAEKMGLPYSNREGWLSGSFARLIREPGNGENLVELGVACPVPEQVGNVNLSYPVSDFGDSGAGGSVRFYGFLENLNAPEIYDRNLETRFQQILEDFQPDMVHIFGTEFPHTLAMVRSFREPERTLIGIQGLCCTIAEAYMADLPYRVQKRVTFRDWYRKDSLEQQQHKFQIRARREEHALHHTAHITGRTSFDRERTGEINPDAVYHKMNETMRTPFYTGAWDPQQMEPGRIFLSQGDYPLKGFHYLLEAMPQILEKFPEAKVCVAGNSIIGEVPGVRKRVPEPLWISSYGLYLKSLIRKNHLQGRVIMLGKLSAEQMKEQYLRCNVFVCPSAVENSPNSLCEAMLLGVPVVASKVGGIGDLVLDGEEGILFPAGRTGELAEGVETILYDSGMASLLGRNAAQRAKIRHNPDTNYRRLLEIYRSICGA